MFKTITTVIIVWLLNLSFTLAQNTSSSEQFINWADATGWSAGNTPNSNTGNINIVIDGSVIRNSGFTLGALDFFGLGIASTLTVKSGDSLVIQGNLTINAESQIIIEDGAYLYVDGNLNNNGEFFLFFIATGDGGTASNDGVIAVTGDYNQGTGASIDNGNGDFFVEGDSDVATNGSIPPEIRNIYTVLPIELKEFEGNIYQNTVELNWVTAKEEDFSHFEIERAIEGGAFEMIGIMEGAGNSLSDVFYNWQDYSAPYGKLLYRLKAVDLDGEYEYSPIVVAQKLLTGKVKASPNPASSLQKVQINLPVDFSEDIDQITLFSLDGIMLYQKNGLEKGLEDLHFPEVENGIYIINLQYNGLSENVRIVIQ